MPLLDIEKAIKSDEISSRFRLVSMASQRARELNTDAESTLPAQVSKYNKVTTNALSEIITKRVDAVEQAEVPSEKPAE